MDGLLAMDSSSDSAISSDESDYLANSDEANDEIRPTTRSLGSNRDYVGNWKPAEAFRELYQNGRMLLSTRLTSTLATPSHSRRAGMKPRMRYRLRSIGRPPRVTANTQRSSSVTSASIRRLEVLSWQTSKIGSR
ncbi:hypothetical protein QBC33DRAFT_313579 [Phialemonium atrogriseum]|uniref:Uncharacterized protein n=1 Tax=Phialemonium atrogriseum TaxID=1093897 RepID=A0AAJ0C7K3_9PEZI|nr:uncharacterized protein QBC33DRAFT_313579 [Phialemonium atrogriseum]KAK1770182.1 hypothetical protein QBC33DRAFT_313579 [Phialemonium atrogriseum]